MIKYIPTREGEQFLGNLLLGSVDMMNITPEQKEMVRQIARMQVQGHFSCTGIPTGRSGTKPVILHRICSKSGLHRHVVIHTEMVFIL